MNIELHGAQILASFGGRKLGKLKILKLHLLVGQKIIHDLFMRPENTS